MIHGPRNKCFEQKQKQGFLYYKIIDIQLKHAKYWQCVREQSSYLDNLMTLSFDYRRNEAKIKWLEGKIEKEGDEYKATKYKIDLDEAIFGKASMEKVAKT